MTRVYPITDRFNHLNNLKIETTTCQFFSITTMVLLVMEIISIFSLVAFVKNTAHSEDFRVKKNIKLKTMLCSRNAIG